MALRNHRHKLIEPMIYQGTADSYTVIGYFKHLLPLLKSGSAVIVDNASYHKSHELKDLFKEYNCTLIFLPPYSPDLNPIENLWGTIKQQLRNYYNYTISLYENLSKVINQYCES